MASIDPSGPTARLLPQIRGELLECPLWSVEEQALYLVDIVGRALIRFHPATGEHRRWAMPSEIGSFACRAAGGLIVALRTGLYEFDPKTDRIEPIWPADYDPATTRFNDGRCDPSGRFWVGTMYEPRDRPAGALYRVDRDRRVTRVIEEVTISNGLAFATDGRTCYFADSPRRLVWAFDLDPERGTLANRRLFVDFAADGIPGRPDGAAIDAEGCYWVALIDAAKVGRFAPDGRLIRTIDVPVRWPTMPCFGGRALQTLYVTSLRWARPAAELAASPESGTLVSVDVDVPGVPEPRFRG